MVRPTSILSWKKKYFLTASKERHENLKRKQIIPYRNYHPLVSYKYLIFSNFSSPFSLVPDGRIWENDFIKSICAAPWHTNQFSSS